MQSELNNGSLFSHVQGYILEFGCPCSFSHCSLKQLSLFDSLVIKPLSFCHQSGKLVA